MDIAKAAQKAEAARLAQSKEKKDPKRFGDILQQRIDALSSINSRKYVHVMVLSCAYRLLIDVQAQNSSVVGKVDLAVITYLYCVEHVDIKISV